MSREYSNGYETIKAKDFGLGLATDAKLTVASKLRWSKIGWWLMGKFPGIPYALVIPGAALPFVILICFCLPLFNDWEPVVALVWAFYVAWLFVSYWVYSAVELQQFSVGFAPNYRAINNTLQASDYILKQVRKIKKAKSIQEKRKIYDEMVFCLDRWYGEGEHVLGKSRSEINASNKY